jgi:hypothetical protein
MPRPIGVDGNICHFLWYGVGAGEGLRSVGAASPSKSVCSILPLARHLRAGEIVSGSTPARGRAGSPHRTWRGPSLCPAPMPLGVSYVRFEPANLYMRNIIPDGWAAPDLEYPGPIGVELCRTS